MQYSIAVSRFLPGYFRGAAENAAYGVALYQIQRVSERRVVCRLTPQLCVENLLD